MFSQIRVRIGARAARRATAFLAALATLSTCPVFSQELTLEDAIQRALAVAPQNQAASARVGALIANRAAVGLPPRPSVEVQTENFGVPLGNLYDQFQITGTYSQQIERGGQREARLAIADRQIDAALAQDTITRLNIIAQVHMAYVEVQATDAAIGVARQRLANAQAVASEVDRRVASARDPIFAGTRARAAVAEAEVELSLATHEHEAALERLALWWGDDAEGLVVPLGRFLDLAPVVGPVEPSPADLAVFQANGAVVDATVAAAQASATRSPTISGGARIIGTGDIGFIAGVSVPLGGRRLAAARVSEAQAERRRVDAEREVAAQNFRRAIAVAFERVEEARHEAEAIQTQVLPVAEQALREVRLGYNRGFFSFADVAAAQTAVTDAALRTVNAAREFHAAKVELDRLTGRFTALAQEASQ